jgi:hypothetical protein
MSDTIPVSELKTQSVTGQCLLEVLDAKDVSGISKDGGKPWAKFEMQLKVIEPANLANRSFKGSIWYNQVEQFVETGLGLKLASIVKDGAVSKSALINLAKGKFFKANVGVDDKGYSRLAKILPKTEEEI